MAPVGGSTRDATCAGGATVDVDVEDGVSVDANDVEGARCVDAWLCTTAGTMDTAVDVDVDAGVDVLVCVPAPVISLIRSST